MKILQVITSLQTGGAEKLVSEIVPLLINKGNQVDVCLFDGQSTMFLNQLKQSNCGCKIISFSEGGNVYNPLNILKLMRIMKDYDIVHTHNTAPQLYAAIGKVLCSVVLVTTEHTTSNRRRGWKWYAEIDRWMYNRYKKVICISDKATENLKEYIRHTRADIVTVYNGIDTEKFRNAQSAENLRENNKFTAVMVAGFRYQKDQDTLIKAMSLLPEEKFELWLVGGGERKEILQDLVKESGLEKNVRFLGVREDVAQVLHSADAVVMSSHFEGLSLSNIEGMSVGKPFIASDVDGLHEMTAGAGLLFEHGNARQLADILLKLQQDPEYCSQVAQKCYDRAKEYDITRMADSYNRIYQELIK